MEAKPDDWGAKITTVETQSGAYATASLKWVKNPEPLRFVYEATGKITRFTDARDPHPTITRGFHLSSARDVAELVPPEPIISVWSARNAGPERNGPQDCQIKAIKKLEMSFREDRPRALVQMATGSGKTFTASHPSLPPSEIRWSPSHPLPGGHQESRGTGRAGVHGLRPCGRQPQVHRTLHCPAALIVLHLAPSRRLHLNDSADVFDPER